MGPPSSLSSNQRGFRTLHPDGMCAAMSATIDACKGAIPRRKPGRSPPPLRARHRGFTLIELMVVVAIVGILAVIAVPQYQIYTGKAQLGEAIQLSESLKAAVSEALQYGMDPVAINGGIAMIPPDITSNAGRYVESVSVAASNVVVTMKVSNVSPCVVGASVTLSPIPTSSDNEPIKWSCSTTAICKPTTCF